MGDVALLGRLHPMLVHFPIGLVLLAAAAAVAAMVTELREWRTVAVAVIGAALSTAGADERSPLGLWVYRVALLWAAALVALTGRLGGLLVWGADFCARE
jgi:uncharacterized membrane protein